MNNISKNKRIVRNTLFLYFRTIIILIITLYTSRVVLNVLGVEDFGIYNVVGGIVLMFSFLNNAMASATQRFIAFELGAQDSEKLKKTFSTLLNIHFIIALVVFVLAETIGLWFLNSKLNIPLERVDAVQWIYHLSIVSFMITVTQVPYNASIIAHEKMDIFAYVSILEVCLKLLFVFALLWFDFDSLKLYSFFQFLVTLSLSVIYRFYCKSKFEECIYQFNWDSTLFKSLLSYSSWNLFGSGIALVLSSQGLNILLNIFFGPIVNAARGIAFQVNSALNTFISSFQMAVKPQIIKSYAQNDIGYMLELVFLSSKYSYFLFFIMSLPVFLETKYVLTLWLGIFPDNSILFCKLILLNALIDCFSGPLVTAVQASGRIKKYQIIIGLLLILNLPISYILLRLIPYPEIVFVVHIVISIFILVARLFLLKQLIEISVVDFFNNVVRKSLLVSIVPVVFSSAIYFFIEEGFLRFILILINSTILTVFSIYFLGIESQERFYIKKKLCDMMKFVR